MIGRAMSLADKRWGAVGALGLAVVVLGTFLPWLRSGHASRDSYQAGGAVRELIGSGGPLDDLLGLWPAIGFVCAAAVAVYLIGLRAVGMVLAGCAAMAGGAAAVGALAATANSFARVAILGPVVTLIGATLVGLAVLLRALVAVGVSGVPDD